MPSHAPVALCGTSASTSHFLLLTSYCSSLTAYCSLLTAVQIPANSAPQRSQYHSVGRLSVPHSPHLSVLATPGAPVLAPLDAGAGAGGASIVRAAGDDWLGLLGRRGEGFCCSSSETDLRKVSSSSGDADAPADTVGSSRGREGRGA